MRVLIVEDEEILAENLCAYLARRQAQVRRAVSAEAAIAGIRDFLADWAVIDYDLPDMDGLQAFSRLKALAPALHGVLVTGRPTDMLAGLAADAGMSRVLAKPFSLAEFQQALQSAPQATPAGGDRPPRGTDQHDRPQERGTSAGGPCLS